MSSETFTAMRCDRCRFEAELRQPSDRIGWGKVFALENPREDRPRTIGSPKEAADTCPGCSDLLIAWWLSPGQVGQPVAPPPPPPPPQPVLNLEDRLRAIALVTTALKVRTEFAMSVIRDEPTSMLSGDVVPGTLFGIEDTAEGIVDGVLDELGFGRKRRQ